jgi:aspartate aminotransferase-like enzyme
MKTYRIGLVPGPTSVPEEVRACYAHDYGSSDLEPEFFALYRETQELLGQIVRTSSAPVIMAGEAMVSLWSALRSCLVPGDHVLAVAAGVFGYGIAEMARACGATVEVVPFGHDEQADPDRVEEAIRRVRPRMVTMVHCETPSGTLHPVDAVGAAVRRHGVELFYVDAVASAGGAPLEVDSWGIDLCLVGTQKVLSCLPDLGILAVSPGAWEAVRRVGYAGYDALLPWQDAVEQHYFPYTLSWAAVAALHTAARRLLDEGLERSITRHARIAALCRRRAAACGVALYPRDERASAPTVTALCVPERLGWGRLDVALRERGVVVGGSYGPLAGHVFRIGHMGTQADEALVSAAMDALAEVVEVARS